MVDAGQRLMRSFGKLPNQHNLLRRSRLLSVRCGLIPRCSDGEMASAMWSLSIDPEEPLHAAPENENPPRRWARGVLRLLVVPWSQCCFLMYHCRTVSLKLVVCFWSEVFLKCLLYGMFFTLPGVVSAPNVLRASPCRRRNCQCGNPSVGGAVSVHVSVGCGAA